MTRTPAPRQTNNGLRKVCRCARRAWAKCPHSWYFNFKPRDGAPYRFSLDKHLGRHIDNKTEAEAEAEEIRIAIRAGTFGQAAPREAMTLRQLADLYLERYVAVERPSTAQSFTWALGTICRTEIPVATEGGAAFGSWRVADIVTDTIERFREARRSAGTGVTGTNRHLASLRALFNWALRVGYVERSPFKRHSEAVVKLGAEHARCRRLDGDTDEESRLLAACGPHLRAVVEAALETGMRRGEILSLQWSQVEGMQLVDHQTIAWAPRAELVLPWSKTKTRRDRRIPISSRLKGILELRRFDPAGEPLPATAYVFGNAIGQRVRDVKRAWMTAVLKSHGHQPRFTATANLSTDSRAALDAIDLHFHDLRREAGSRWLEGGVLLHVIRDWLGHTSIAQTSTYLAGTIRTQHDAMAQYEARRTALPRKRKARSAKPRNLQPFATGVVTGGRKSPPAAERRDGKPNETGDGRKAAIM